METGAVTDQFGQKSDHQILQDAAVGWHVGAGGKNVRLAGHALRLLNEAVELCVAAGARPGEIHNRVVDEIAKADGRGEFRMRVDPAVVRAELVDVQILGDILAHHTGDVCTDTEYAAKLPVLAAREWEPDKDGALWRPGRAPR